MDGVVYGTAIGLGFAAVENLLYLLGAGTHWGTLAIIRGVLSVPLHGALGAIAGAYIVGGLIPLSPYFFFTPATKALLISVMATLLALLVFGYIKGRFTGTRPFRSALQTVFIGGLAAAAAFLIARLISR